MSRILRVHIYDECEFDTDGLDTYGVRVFVLCHELRLAWVGGAGFALSQLPARRLRYF